MKLTVSYALLYDVEVPDTEVKKILKNKILPLSFNNGLDDLCDLVLNYTPKNILKVIDENDGEIDGIFDPNFGETIY